MKRFTTLLLGAALLAAWTVPAFAQDAVSEQKKAQNKLLAYRAARADAMRKLAERIKGLHITSETTVKDFVAESDQIQTAMQAFLMGAEEVGNKAWNLMRMAQAGLPVPPAKTTTRPFSK